MNETTSVEVESEPIGPPPSPSPALSETPAFVLASAGVTLALLCVSLASTLPVVLAATCRCSRAVTSRGYFHSATLFCLLNLLYFVLRAAEATSDSLRLLEAAQPPAEVTSARFVSLWRDCCTCLFGSSLLVLSAMCLDALASHCCGSRLLQRCCRSVDAFVYLAQD